MIQKKEYTAFKKSVKEIAGFKDCFPVTKATDPEECIEAEVIFHSLQPKYRKYLEKYLKRRKAKIISDTEENNGIINPESRRVMVNGLIASLLSIVGTVFSANGFSAILQANITFVDSLIYASGPAIAAFLSTILIYYKR